MKRKLSAALLCLCASFGMMTAVAMADDAHPHTDHSCDASCTAHVSGDPHKRGESWTAWDKDDSLPTETDGYYYLTKDVTIGGDCPDLSGKNITICLNGYDINLNRKYIKVRNKSELTITDCGDSGNGNKIEKGENTTEPSASDWEPGHGGAVYINESTFNLYAGTISGNTAQCGGAVYCYSGAFNMYGGTISGNTAMEGGGVYIRKGTFDLQGGEIASNNATRDGGGIFVASSKDDETTFYLSKKPSIQSNKNWTTDSPKDDGTQVYLYDRAVITLKGVLTYTTPIPVYSSYTNGGLLVKDWLPSMNGKKPSDYFKSTRSNYPYIVVKGFNLETAATNPKSTPTAIFTAKGDSYGELSGVSDGMKYKIHRGELVGDYTISGTTVSLNNLEPCEIWVINPGDSIEYTDSAPQKIQVTKAEAPTGLSVSHCTAVGGSNGKITGVTAAMEYKKADAVIYTGCTGTEITGLAAGEYQVRVKANGTVLASAYTTVKVGSPCRIEMKKSISGEKLDADTPYTFPERSGTNYDVPLLFVDVTNTGTLATGELTVELTGTNADKFEIAKGSTIDSIDVDNSKTAAFKVQPKGNLEVGAYNATVTVKNTVNGIDESFDISFEVIEIPPLSAADISVDRSGTYTFSSAGIGYTDPQSVSVTIMNNNNGNSAGPFTVALDGTNANCFTLSPNSVGQISHNGSSTFTVSANAGLAVGTYNAVVKITASNPASYSYSFNVSFTVTESYEIALKQTAGSDLVNLSGTVTLKEVDVSNIGTVSSSKTITVQNVGAHNPGELQITLSGANPDAFVVSPATISGIDPNDSKVFTVAPKNTLTAGTYTAKVTVGNSNVGYKSFDVKITVTSKPQYKVEPEYDSYNFSLNKGYTEADAKKTIKLKNTGLKPIGNISITVDDTVRFVVSPTNIQDNIPAGGSRDITVELFPNTPPGKYSGRLQLTVSSMNDYVYIPFTFRVKDDYGISLSQTENYTFPDANKGYTDSPSLNVAVENMGMNPTGELTITLSGANVDSFDCPSSITGIAVDASSSFIIKPKAGLDLGDYTATVTVKNEANNISESFDISFTVKGTTPASSSGTVHDGIGTIGHEVMSYSPDDDTMTEGACIAYGEAAYYPLLDVNGDFITDHRLVENLRIKVKYTEGGDLVNGEPQLVKLRVEGEYRYFIKFDIKKELSHELRDVCGTLTLNKSKKGKVDGKDYRVKDLSVDFSFEVGSSFNYSDNTIFVVDGDLDIPLWANEFFILKYDCDEEVEFEFGSESNEGSFTVDTSGQGKNIITFNTELDENVANSNPDAKIIAINFNEVRFNRSGVFRYEADDMEYAYAIRGGKLVEVGRFEGGEVEFSTNTLGRYLFSDVELVSPESINEVEFVRAAW